MEYVVNRFRILGTSLSVQIPERIRNPVQQKLHEILQHGKAFDETEHSVRESTPIRVRRGDGVRLCISVIQFFISIYYQTKFRVMRSPPLMWQTCYKYSPFRDMHKELCDGKPGLCDAMKPTKGTELLKYLRKVDFEGKKQFLLISKRSAYWLLSRPRSILLKYKHFQISKFVFRK